MRVIARIVPIGLLLAGLVSTAAAEALTDQCGAVLRSTVKTTTDPYIFSAESPNTVPNAVFLVNVPTGTTRCVVITFSASARCPLACFVFVRGPNSFMNPAETSNRFAQGDVFRAHTFQWVQRLGPGQYPLRIQIGRGNNIGSAQIGPYTAKLTVRE